MMTEVYCIGSQFKYAIGLECAGLTAKDIDFTARFSCFSNKYQDIEKSDMLYIEDSNEYIAIVDTTLLSEGDVSLTITAKIPDSDIKGGERTEIASIKTGIHLRKRI